ncbi:hypothetical protein FJZ28_01365 [Candidatus Peregrinibacteria bacterium]|nr:hypothetical protein [Candidatus Peregrinibacteria bacterium]
MIGICIVAIATNGIYSRRDRIKWERTSMLQVQAKSCLESYTTTSDACLHWLYPWDIPMDHLPCTAAPLLENMKFLDVFTVPPDATFIDTPDHSYGAMEKSAQRLPCRSFQEWEPSFRVGQCWMAAIPRSM